MSDAPVDAVELAGQVARLGYVLDAAQVDDVSAAVAAAEPAVAALRDRPRPMDVGADPAHGDAWPRRARPARVVERDDGDRGSGFTDTERLRSHSSDTGRGAERDDGDRGSGVTDTERLRSHSSDTGRGADRDDGDRGSGFTDTERLRSHSSDTQRLRSHSSDIQRPRSHSADAPGVADLLRAYAAGDTTPERVVADALAGLDAAHAVLNCTIRTLDERAGAAAAESARRWAAGTARPLEGVPFGVKDVIDIAGVPTTAGSHARDDEPAATSATVVARLEAAGAIPVSKDATTEFAVGGPHPPRFGVVRNPWDLGRWAGGSSTGSAAAVAARALPFALGTDVGGSVRLPSAWCGLTGLKPTAGVVPRTGVVPLSWTAETVGPLCRSADDLALVLDQLRGVDGADPRSVRSDAGDTAAPDLTGLRVAVLGGDVTAWCDAGVRAGLDALVDVLVGAGADVVDDVLPGAAAALPIGYQIVFTEAASLHRIDADRWDHYDPVTVRRISQGIVTPAADYLRALQFRVELQRELDAVLERADIVLTPTCPSTAPHLPDATVIIDGEVHPLYAAQSRSTMIANLTGAPALALPTGLAADGCPVSAQLIGAPHDEATLLRVAGVVQDRTGHHRRRPPHAVDPSRP